MKAGDRQTNSAITHMGAHMYVHSLLEPQEALAVSTALGKQISPVINGKELEPADHPAVKMGHPV